MSNNVKDAWELGRPYEQYVGRWSRPVALEFLAWLGLPPNLVWADVGCGTGALMQSILGSSKPQSVFAIDKSLGFLAVARSTLSDRRAHVAVADGAALPWATTSCDAVVSGLVLNFVPDALAMVREMARVTRPHCTVAVYVWDYGRGMEMMRHFWDTVIAVSPHDAALDEAKRFPLCRPEPLKALFQEAGLSSVAVRSIAVPTVFQDFDDYWTPFLGKQGPAPTYLASLDDQRRDRIREVLRSRLVTASNGSIALTAAAWAVRGTV